MRTILLTVVGIALFAVSGCGYKINEYNKTEDLALISQQLKVPQASIKCERIVIDNSRPVFCVFFHASGVSQEALSATFDDYRKVSETRSVVHFHTEYWRKLKDLKWGPYENYKQLPEYVGYWNDDYAVYIAYENGDVHGYMEYTD